MPEQLTERVRDRIVRPREAFGRLGVSRATLWRMVRRGDLPKPLQITRGAVGWRESTIDRFLDDREAEASEGR